jgi:undecaprenyl-phosphate galactose phosphotransferase
VSGRNQLPFSERLRLEEYYVRNWSPWLDLIILLRTGKAVITGTGAA